MPPNDRSRARTTQKSFRILEELLHRDEPRITELAEHLEMSKSTIHNHLNTLHQCGYVVKDGAEYRVGLKFLEIGGFIRSRIDLYQYARPEVADLRDETGESIYLSIEEAGEGVVLIEAGNPSTATEWYTGKRFSLSETPEGKTMLAEYSDSRLEEVLAAEFDGDQAQLREELSAIQTDGFALSSASAVGEIWRVAVPIREEDGSLVGTLSLADEHDADMTGPSEAIIQSVRDTASRIEQRLELAWYDSESVVTPKHSLSSYTEQRRLSNEDETK